jgi:hypothetical protein
VGIDDNATSTAITIDASETTELKCQAGDANVGAKIYHPTSTSARHIVKFQSNVGGTQVDKAVIDCAGNVGIGVTPESWSSTHTAIDIGQTGSIAGQDSANRLYSMSNAYDNSGYKYKTTSQASSHEQSNGAHYFFVAASGTADTAITWTTPLTIANTGDVTVGTGNLVIGTSGKGIDFSATSNGSGTMTSEVLDDYEEGTWTPVLKVGTTNQTTYAIQNGHYTKIGNLVTASVSIKITSLSGTGTVNITGLPFPNFESRQYCGAPVINEGGGSGAYPNFVYGLVWANAEIYCRYNNGSGYTGITNTAISSNVHLFWTGTYKVA